MHRNLYVVLENVTGLYSDTFYYTETVKPLRRLVLSRSYLKISLEYDNPFYRDLSYNFIDEIEDQLYSPMKSLTTLNMKRNMVSSIDENMFKSNMNLELA